MTTPLQTALLITLQGLQDIIPGTDDAQEGKTSLQNLRWMCATALENHAHWPTDKTSRWIGFIQGVLAVRGFLDVDVERDRTRPLFHAAYQAMEVQVPKTQEMS